MVDDDGPGAMDSLTTLDLPDNEVHHVLPGGAALDEEMLEDAIYEIKRTAALAGLARIIAIAECIVRIFALGDREQFRAAHKRHVTWRALADHQERLGIDFTTLNRYVGVYYQLEKFPKELSDAMDPSAHIALLPLTDDTTRLALASKTAQLGLTTRELRAEVAAAGPEKKSGRGRKATPAATKALRALSKGVDDLDTADIGEIDPATARAHVGQIDRQLAVLTRVRAALVALELGDDA